MNNTNKTNATEEIDLGYLINKFNNLFIKTVQVCFELISFLNKKKFLLGALLLLSILYAFYKERTAPQLNQTTVIVIPNFESIDYLNDKVEFLNAKISAKDTLYLKNNLGENYNILRKIDIEPIEGVFDFLGKSRENIDVLRVLYQNQDFNDFIEHVATSKNYKYHKMSFLTRPKGDSKALLENTFDYLNNNAHFKRKQEIFLEESAYQLEQFEHLIIQVDSIISSIVNSNNNSNTSGQSVNISDNSNLHQLLYTKGNFMENKMELAHSMVEKQQIINPIKKDFDAVKKTSKLISNKILYPFIVLLLFSLYFIVLKGYNKLKHIAETN